MKQPVVLSMKRFIRPVVLGISAGAAVCAVLLLLLSVLMMFRDIPQAVAAFLSSIVLVVGGFSAGYVSAASARERGLPVGLCCGMALFLLLCLAWLTMGGTGFSAQAVAKLAAVSLAAAIGGIFGVNKKRRFKKT